MKQVQVIDSFISLILEKLSIPRRRVITLKMFSDLVEESDRGFGYRGTVRELDLWKMCLMRIGCGSEPSELMSSCALTPVPWVGYGTFPGHSPGYTSRLCDGQTKLYYKCG